MHNNDGDTAAEAALSYIRAAEQRCLASSQDPASIKINRVGVIGLGTMGVGISTGRCCAQTLQ